MQLHTIDKWVPPIPRSNLYLRQLGIKRNRVKIEIVSENKN